jgi:hypothetical protein
MTVMRLGALATLGLLLVAGVASAADQSPGATTKQKAGTYSTKHLRTVTLTVKNVDSKNHKVQFEAKVEPEANLTESGRPIKLDQLKEGDTVRASFDPKTGDVVRVDVTPAK